MIVELLPLAGAARIRPERRADARGWFARSFCAETFARHGLPTEFPQHNLSFNARAGTLRGLHFQHPPHEEPKVISCPRGAILDVIVDLRPGSATWGRWHAAELSAANGEALYAPPGFAHGFQALADDTLVHYLMGAAFVDGAAGGLRFDDPALAIPWPLPVSVISERDRALPTLSQLSLPKA